MGKKNKRKEAKRQWATQAVAAVLTEHSQRATDRKPAETCSDFKPAYCGRVDAYEAQALHPSAAWRCRIKSRSEDKRFLDLVRFTFARYPVAAHLEKVWIEEFDDDFVDAVRPHTRNPRLRALAPDLRAWYIIATQGGSLYKRGANRYLSKLETHHFLTAPAQVNTAQRAFWYAYARAQSDDVGVALRVARSKLVDFSVCSSFWQEVARFFARNPTSPAEINDLIDFLHAAKQEAPAFSLKGRGLPALRRHMEDWHRALRKQHTIGGGFWAGCPLPDSDYETGGKNNKAIWRFRQIKAGTDLFREGQRMHHCVASYKSRCISGEVSIWSLTCEYPLGQLNRGVTLEVGKDGRIRQCRGFANRGPHANEASMVKRWAQEHGLGWDTCL